MTYDFVCNIKLWSYLQADLNGDGAKEVILVSHKDRIQVISPSLAGRQGDGFARATELGSSDLIDSHVRIPVGRRPIALAAGYLDPPLAALALAPRKMVVVVVTTGWTVIVFDHNFVPLWETNIAEKFPRHTSISEV